MEKNELAYKAFELVQANDKVGYQNFLHSLTSEEHLLFVEQIKDIETLIALVKKI